MLPRFLAGAMLVLATSGCAVNAVKALDGHVSSAVEQDCRVVNLIRGEKYCQHPPLAEGKEPALYCFRTLAGIDCHADKDPYGVGESGRTLTQPIVSDAENPDAG